MRPNNEIAAAASNIWERRHRTTWSSQNVPTDGGHTRKPMWLFVYIGGPLCRVNECFLPQNRDCTRIGRLCARSCIVPRRPGRNPPANRSPKGCQTPKWACSDGCSTASRTVAAAGDPFSDCSTFGRSENRDQTRNYWYCVVSGPHCRSIFLLTDNNTTTTSSRLEDDLLCEFACAHHKHTYTHWCTVRTHTLTWNSHSRSSRTAM